MPLAGRFILDTSSPMPTHFAGGNWRTVFVLAADGRTSFVEAR